MLEFVPTGSGSADSLRARAVLSETVIAGGLQEKWFVAMEAISFRDGLQRLLWMQATWQFSQR